MRIFHQDARASVAPCRQGQSVLDWLDKSSLPMAEVARANLQHAFDHIPEGKQASLMHRLRQCGDDHVAAVVEIFAHEMLLQSGYQVTIEPHTSTGSVPEFLIRSQSFEAYVEVTVDLGPAQLRRDRKAIEDLIAAASQKVKTPGFGICLEEAKRGAKNISSKRFAAFLDEWFGTLNHATERARLSDTGRRSLSTRIYEDNSGWKLRMSLLPLETLDKRLERIVGIGPIETAWSEGKPRLKENIVSKLRQHRDRSRPLIVVVAGNELMHGVDDADVVPALYGTSRTVNWLEQPPGDFTVGQPSGDSRPIWMDDAPSKNERLAGVIILRTVLPWTFENVVPELWDNPHLPASKLMNPWAFDRFSWKADGSLQVSVDRERRVLSFARRG